MNRKRGRIVIFVALITAMLSIVPLIAQVIVDGKRHVPDPTNEGSFAGTWFYIDRDKRFALFFREYEGKIQAKLRWEMYSDEAFETDWNGKCTYMFRGNEGKVSFEIANPENKNQLEGKWSWRLDTDSGQRSEQGSFKIYRSDNGYRLAWIMPDWYQLTVNADKERKFPFEQMHILRKASNRIISWEEIPFN